MTTFATELWRAIAGVFELRQDAFAAALSDHRYGWLLSVITIVLAGFSQAVGQSAVLFANRVKAGRFIFCLLLDALLFAAGYVFLVASTWAVLWLAGRRTVAFEDLAIVLALSYAPLLFAFLSALPYLGRNLFWALRIWHLLAMVVGIMLVTGTEVSTAVLYCGAGWLVLSIANQTFAKPLALFGQRLLNAVSGVSLVTSEQVSVDRMFPGHAHNAALAHGGATETVAPSTALQHEARPRDLWVKPVIGGVAILAIAYVVTVTLAPLHHAVFGWQAALPAPLRLPFDLLWIGLIGVLVAGFMAPVETLGWWAGWFGDRVQTVAPDASDAKPGPDVKRYVVYLDGISQSSSRYMPDVEHFLDQLGPRLPAGMELVRGVMTYSPINRPLEEDPILAWFWSIVDRVRFANPTSLLGMIVNLRNVLIVAVSADSRYGPMYNFGVAQLIYDALIANGYRVNSGTPVTLIGYSGGGQMGAGCGSFLRRALDAPVDMISLGGVISGDCPILELEHLYHFTGTRDHITTLGPIMFASRWKIAGLSGWNRALRLGRLSRFSLGPVGHQVPGGMMDPKLILADGQSALEQTLQRVTGVLGGVVGAATPPVPQKPSNYSRYIEAAANRPETYPLGVAVEPHFRPLGTWLGRLILPERGARFREDGVWFEVALAPDDQQALIGRRVALGWVNQPAVADFVHAVTHDVHFSAEAIHSSRDLGNVHPVRLDNWQLVGPLESLAGSRPVDDMVVLLEGPVVVKESGHDITLEIERQPVQVSGRYYGLVRFVAAQGADRYEVVHFDRARQDFATPGVVRVPAVVPDADGRLPYRFEGITESRLNERGWYVYGAPDADGTFVVQSLAPRVLLALEPMEVLPHAHAFRYVRHGSWNDLVQRHGGITSVKLGEVDWNVGDEALLVHEYGGIGGTGGEKLASGPVYFGHFAYGFARVVAEPLTGAPRFDFEYAQVYCQNTDGLIAGRLHLSRYLADRQFGWIGLRPTFQLLLKLPTFPPAALRELALQLDAMTSRYRIGDGTGGTFVSAANNCAQDSNRALFAALGSHAESRPLARDLRRQLALFGTPRRDWTDNAFNLGSTMQDEPLDQLRAALGSWRVILPRKAGDTISRVLLRHGANAWFLGTSQVHDRTDIAPVVPMTF